MSAQVFSKISKQWKNKGAHCFDQLDQAVHTASEKDKRTGENVVQKDEPEIGQNEIWKARSVLHVFIDSFEQRQLRSTTNLSSLEPNVVFESKLFTFDGWYLLMSISNIAERFEM